MNLPLSGVAALLGCAVLGAAGTNNNWERQFDLGRALASQGRYREAREALEQAREQAERFGSGDVRLAVTLNQLGTVDARLDNLREAERCYRRAAAIWELRHDAAKALTPLTNLAGAYLVRQDYRAADSLLHGALSLSDLALGPDDPHTAAIRTYLADLALSRGDYATAASQAEAALATARRTHGPADPVLATALDNLGTVYRAQGKREESSRLFEEAIGVLEKSGQPDHPAWVPALEDSSSVLFERRSYAEADALLQRALALAEARLGPNHPEVARVLHERAVVLRKAGQKSEARKLDARAAQIRSRAARDNALGYTVDLSTLSGFRR